MNLSADVFLDDNGWSAVIKNHPPKGGDGTIVWERHRMGSERVAGDAMEKAWKRLSGMQS